MKITKAKLKQIIKEELSEVFRLGVRPSDLGPEEQDAMKKGQEKQAAAEKEMENYLIEKGVYEKHPTGGISIMTGIVGVANKVLSAAAQSGEFEQQAVNTFIDKLHELIR